MSNVESLPDNDPPFKKKGRHDTYWGYHIVYPDEVIEVWVQNPRYGDDDDPVADYDDLWDVTGRKIDIEDAEEAGWIDDLHDAILQDLHDTYEPEPGW